MRRLSEFLPGATALLLVLAVSAPSARSQTPGDAASPIASTQPAVITLDEAIHRAEANEPAFAAAVAQSKSSALDRSIARAGLLPSAVYHNQALYTQPNNIGGTISSADSTQKFIANNSIREYASQASINETFGLAGLAGVRRADAASAMAAAELEVARRGLVAAVVSLFYGSLAADHKLTVAERAHQEATDFTSLTDKREQAREAAHADVVKAQLEEQQRQRDLEDARLVAAKARLELGILLFPDPRTPYKLQAVDVAPALAPREDVEQAAAKNNPELKSALAALSVSNADVQAARAAYLPDLGLNFTYGIDAAQFAVNGPGGVRNLGYSASITLDIPVWDWLSTQHKVRQSTIRRDVAKVVLSATQRRLIARLDEVYAEAETARNQFASLDASASTAAESLRLTKLRYTGGEATVLEVVDAQKAYVLAQNAREDGRVRYEAARADLQSLTGTM
ncbi:MAG: TolC family protein [Terracidiphilus sp.]|nr:TolC family protein [Terracidiphilus sp.]